MVREWHHNHDTNRKKTFGTGSKRYKKHTNQLLSQTTVQKKTGPKFDYVALKAWCNNHSTIPSVQDMDKMFVARTEFNVNNYELVNFKILVTTRRLVGYALYSKC